MRVMLVLDTSGSMEDDNKIDALKEGMKGILDELETLEITSIGLILFGSYQGDRNAIEIFSRFDRNINEIRARIGQLEPEGPTALYETINMAVDMLEPNDLVILVTDARDEPHNGRRRVMIGDEFYNNLVQLLNSCQGIYIGVGNGDALDLLRAIARDTNQTFFHISNNDEIRNRLRTVLEGLNPIILITQTFENGSNLTDQHRNLMCTLFDSLNNNEKEMFGTLKDSLLEIYDGGRTFESQDRVIEELEKITIQSLGNDGIPMREYARRFWVILEQQIYREQGDD